MSFSLTLLHLYPHELNMYGDRGNVLALVQRALWRGITLDVMPVGLGEDFDPDLADIIFIGGGQDTQQMAVSEDLLAFKQKAMTTAAQQKVVMLAICGGYQLLGHYYKPHQGSELRGLSLLDVYTMAGTKRLIGNIALRREDGTTLVGFENHSGQTFLGEQKGLAPLGQVLAGYGNNGQSGEEGAVFENIYGTYLHGSLLPKNPALSDELLLRALIRRYGHRKASELMRPLPDAIELAAHQAAIDLAHRQVCQRRRSVFSGS
jgi:CobQ-like glutamine amidotransferase family enzyme